MKTLDQRSNVFWIQTTIWYLESPHPYHFQTVANTHKGSRIFKDSFKDWILLMEVWPFLTLKVGSKFRGSKYCVKISKYHSLYVYMLSIQAMAVSNIILNNSIQHYYKSGLHICWPRRISEVIQASYKAYTKFKIFISYILYVHITHHTYENHFKFWAFFFVNFW